MVILLIVILTVIIIALRLASIGTSALVRAANRVERIGERAVVKTTKAAGYTATNAASKGAKEIADTTNAEDGGESAAKATQVAGKTATTGVVAAERVSGKVARTTLRVVDTVKRAAIDLVILILKGIRFLLTLILPYIVVLDIIVLVLLVTVASILTIFSMSTDADGNSLWDAGYSGSHSNNTSLQEQFGDSLPDYGFKSYPNITDDEIYFLAQVMIKENSETDRSKAFEASIFCNLYEKRQRGGYDAGKSNPAQAIKDGSLKGWFAPVLNGTYTSAHPTQRDLDIVKAVVQRGCRVIPSYICEHDYIGDLEYIDTNGVHTDPSDRSSYVKDVSICVQSSSSFSSPSSWIFYEFPGSNSDPFGYYAADKEDPSAIMQFYTMDQLEMVITGRAVSEGKTNILLIGDSRSMQLGAFVLNQPYPNTQGRAGSTATVNSGGSLSSISGYESYTGTFYVLAKGSEGIAWTQDMESTIDSLVTSNTAVVYNMGTNDVGIRGRWDTYPEWLNRKAPQWEAKGAKVYFMSTNPVNESSQQATLTNAQVQEFNTSVKTRLNSSIAYLDSYSYLMSKGIQYSDWLHYRTSTSRDIWDFIVSNVYSEGSSSTTAGSGTMVAHMKNDKSQVTAAINMGFKYIEADIETNGSMDLHHAGHSSNSYSASEFLQDCKADGVTAIFDVKVNQATVLTLYNEIKSAGMLSNAIFQTANSDMVTYIRGLDPNARIWWLTGSSASATSINVAAFDAIADKVEAVNTFAGHVNGVASNPCPLEKSFIDHCHSKGVKVCGYSFINGLYGRAAELKGYGIDYLMSNDMSETG